MKRMEKLWVKIGPINYSTLNYTLNTAVRRVHILTGKCQLLVQILRGQDDGPYAWHVRNPKFDLLASSGGTKHYKVTHTEMI